MRERKNSPGEDGGRNTEREIDILQKKSPCLSALPSSLALLSSRKKRALCIGGLEFNEFRVHHVFQAFKAGAAILLQLFDGYPG